MEYAQPNGASSFVGGSIASTAYGAFPAQTTVNGAYGAFPAQSLNGEIYGSNLSAPIVGQSTVESPFAATYGTVIQAPTVAYGVSGAPATGQQSNWMLSLAQFALSDMKKREIRIPVGGIVSKAKWVKKPDGTGSVIHEDETETFLESVHNVTVVSGVQTLVEKQVVKTRPKPKTTSEYVYIPSGCDVLEITSSEGSALSATLVEALKAQPRASAAVRNASEIVWGAPIEKTPGIIKIHGLKLSPFAIPVEALCVEVGIDYEYKKLDFTTEETKKPEFRALNAMHTVPTIEHENVTLWESRTILRYIAGKFGLESWYPSDPKKRAICDLALDFHANSFVPLVGSKVYGPVAFKDYGYKKPTDQELADAEKKWNDDVWPALEHLLGRNPDGPLLGGASPSIADLMFVGPLFLTFASCPDSFVAREQGLSKYWNRLKQALPALDDYTSDLKAFLDAQK